MCRNGPIANTLEIVALFLARGLRLAGLDAVIGIGGAVSVARLLQSLLYETPAINLRGYVTAAAFILLVAALAAYLPAVAPPMSAPSPPFVESSEL